VPVDVPFGDETLVPLRAGSEVRWRVAGADGAHRIGAEQAKTH
jgi:hypothetical protein